MYKNSEYKYMNYTKEYVLERLKIFSDPNFTFNEEQHVYKYDGKVLNGTTTYLKRFCKPFDTDYWSKKKAEQAGITQAEMIAQWDEKRDRSCYLGTEVHNYIEDFYMLNSTKLSEDPEANERIEKFHRIYESRLKKLEPIISEQRVFHLDWGIAGMIDQLYLYNGELIMGDWKTNKKINTQKDFAFGKLLSPFEKYKDCELNKYSLQISIYSLMLEAVGLDISYGFICHIPGKGDSKIYKLLDFKTELRTYLNHASMLEHIDEDDAEENELLW